MKSKPINLVKIITVFCLIFLIASCDKTKKDSVYYDGYTYQTVQIGNQIWMKENLRTSKYNDGSPIPTNLDDNAWLNDTIGAYTIYAGTDEYKDTTKNNKKYGKLYNWHAVHTGKLAPKGWHVATKEDYEILLKYLTYNEAASKMRTKKGWEKAKGVVNTNSSKFSAKPGGCKNYGFGCSNDMRKVAYFWTSSKEALDKPSGVLYPTSLIISYDNPNNVDLNEGYYKPECGMSVRCVKD